MGSKTGKYNVENDSSIRNGNNNSSSLPSHSNGSPSGQKSRKEGAFLPTLIHKDSLTDASLSNKNNLSLVWLDTELNNRPSHIDTQIKLKNIINYLRIFTETDACERYITGIGRINDNEFINEEKLFVIISPILALTVISQIHHFPQVKYIYIYGTAKIDSKIIRQMLQKYPKVKGIFSTSRSLLAQISEDQYK